MRKQFNKITAKVMPVIERTLKWVISTAFELLKLASLAFVIFYLVDAPMAIELTLAAITVFASLYFTKFWK